jgi:hypothetical protein
MQRFIAAIPNPSCSALCERKLARRSINFVVSQPRPANRVIGGLRLSNPDRMKCAMLDQTNRQSSITRFDAGMLTAMHGLAAWRSACFDPAAPDSVLHHQPARRLNTRPQGSEGDASGLGHDPGGDPGDDRGDDRGAHYELAAVSSVSLASALLDPVSMAILSPALGLFARSVDTLPGPLQGSLQHRDAIVTPVAGADIHDVRHFLYHGVPSAVMLRGLLGANLQVAGPVLQPWQAELLAALGLDQGYYSITGPTKFTRIIATDMTQQATPSRFARGVIDRLRFRFGQDHARTRRLIVGTVPAEIADEAREFGFEAVELAALTMAEQARLLASATAVIGPSGSALTLVGFCDPGTAILELQTHDALEDWTQVLCALFGLDWYGLVTDAPDAARPTGLDQASLRACLRHITGPK